MHDLDWADPRDIRNGRNDPIVKTLQSVFSNYFFHDWIQPTLVIPAGFASSISWILC